MLEYIPSFYNIYEIFGDSVSSRRGLWGEKYMVTFIKYKNMRFAIVLTYGIQMVFKQNDLQLVNANQFQKKNSSNY